MAANLFKSAKVNALSTSWSDLYTSPNGKKTILTSLKITNIATTNITVSMRIVDATDSENTYVGKDIPVQIGQLVDLIEEKLVLEGGDKIQLTCDTGSGADIWASLIEDVN